jgi:threonine dehydrogenase-like Zn-dependent dehydrogenase
MGASHIIMTDVLDYRLQLAKKLGADVVVNVANEDP